MADKNTAAISENAQGSFEEILLENDEQLEEAARRYLYTLEAYKSHVQANKTIKDRIKGSEEGQRFRIGATGLIVEIVKRKGGGFTINAWERLSATIRK